MHTRQEGGQYTNGVIAGPLLNGSLKRQLSVLLGDTHDHVHHPVCTVTMSECAQDRKKSTERARQAIAGAHPACSERLPDNCNKTHAPGT